MTTISIRVVTVMVLCMHLLETSSSELESRSEKRSGARYCGRNLADIIKIVCGGNYNALMQKKSGGDLVPADFPRSDLDDEGRFWLQNTDLEEPIFPFRPKFIATSLVPGSFRRLTRGAYDECCRKSCTLQEIRTYCAPSPATSAPQSVGQWTE